MLYECNFEAYEFVLTSLKCSIVVDGGSVSPPSHTCMLQNFKSEFYRLHALQESNPVYFKGIVSKISIKLIILQVLEQILSFVSISVSQSERKISLFLSLSLCLSLLHSVSLFLSLTHKERDVMKIRRNTLEILI